MPGLSYIFSKEGKLVYWGSKKAWQLLEYSDEDLENKYVLEFIDEADREKVLSVFQNVFKEGYGQVECFNVAKSGITNIILSFCQKPGVWGLGFMRTDLFIWTLELH
ncbi:MAG: hypothetical protein IH618_09270 [Ignavibacteriaceae bacterium]|nr:hypothetical protein [Ignavibacteriaceae bacterium]